MLNKTLTILGLMSGSSLDGLDAAFVRFNEAEGILRWELIEAYTLPFTKNWEEKLKSLPGTDGLDLSLAHVYFGRYMAELIKEPLEKSEIQPDMIASHGHTVYHFPDKFLSLQIGDGASLSALTGLPVVCDFRSQDVASGGQGAPLAPIADKLLFPGYDFYLNLGGIANITSITEDKIIAFDICPANQMLNFLASLRNQSFDENGAWARTGKLHSGLLEALSNFDYYEKPHPKSLDNNWIRKNVLPLLAKDGIILEDRLHTACIFIAGMIRDNLTKLNSGIWSDLSKSPKILVTGGGAFNTFLMECITTACREQMEVEIILPSNEIIAFKEAILTALLGYLRYQNRPNCLSAVTGAPFDLVGGAIYQGRDRVLDY